VGWLEVCTSSTSVLVYFMAHGFIQFCNYHSDREKKVEKNVNFQYFSFSFPVWAGKNQGRGSEFLAIRINYFFHWIRILPVRIYKIISILKKIKTRINKFKLKMMVYKIEFYAYLPKI